jgi:hypothetical protein
VISLSRDGNVENNGYCKMVDKDGDMWLFKFADRNFVGKFDVVVGTGKYDGMSMAADFKPVTAWWAATSCASKARGT